MQKSEPKIKNQSQEFHKEKKVLSSNKKREMEEDVVKKIRIT
jgi:hypothetical protein